LKENWVKLFKSFIFINIFEGNNLFIPRYRKRTAPFSPSQVIDVKMSRITSRSFRLPMELLHMIAKDLEDADCLALSLTGLLYNFESLYHSKR